MVMFACGPNIDVSLSREKGSLYLRLVEVLGHLPGVNTFPQPEENRSVRSRIQHVVALILSVKQAESFADVIGQRVNLQGEVAPLHGVPGNRSGVADVRTKTAIHWILSQQFTGNPGAGSMAG